ncbi:MAG: response regulator [Terriglobales bacterium]|jgi:CheY-like chemotaxis protein
MSMQAYPELQSAVVLCIADDEDMLECEKSFLECFGYVVLTASSGGKGLELASLFSVDVVIVDYLMPKMNGHDVALEMRRLLPLAPIILLSESGEVPEQTMHFADALVSKDRLDSQLLPAIAQLQGRGGIPLPSYHA